MTRPGNQTWLHRFALLTAATVLCLVGIGGLVTSKGAGMAVPDWPTSYGYNMFFFPIQDWIGGIFYEHTHRLLAAFVGLLTSILAGWIWVRETQGRTRWLGLAGIVILVGMLGHRGSGQATGGAAGIPMHFKVLAGVMPVLLVFGVVQIIRTKGALRWLAMTAFFAVIFQGILGGFRVALYQDQIGIFHATLAQLFLVLVAGIALVTSNWWQQLKTENFAPVTNSVRYAFLGVSLLILTQLILGASMRHQHAGLAVPDFPLAYGKIWPATDAVTLQAINQERVDIQDYKAITAGQIYLHMAHRATALLILVSALACVWMVRRNQGTKSSLFRAAFIWLCLILLQATLGAATVWSNKAADIATLHVVIGATSLVFASQITFVLYKVARVSVIAPQTSPTRVKNSEEVAGSPATA